MKPWMISQRRVLRPEHFLVTIFAAVMGLTASAQPTNCTPPPSGLAGWWAGEGSAADSYGTNNGTLQGE